MTDDLRQRYAEAIGTAMVLRTSPSEIADAVLRLRDEEMERLREERDQAIAHDRQPYPTQWAYDQACAALEKHRARAEADRDRMNQALRDAGIEYPLGAPGIADLAAMAEGRLEDLQSAEAAIARVRRLCDLTITASCRVEAINQARDTLTALEDPEAGP